jgi:hypothetical protein
MRLFAALAAVLWPVVAIAQSAPQSAPAPQAKPVTTPLVGLDGATQSGPARPKEAPIPDARGGEGPALIGKTRWLDPDPPPPSSGMMVPGG